MRDDPLTLFADERPPSARQRDATPCFLIEWGGEASLTVDEIWPDGDAPENPTAEDVIAEMLKAGSIRRLVQNWNFDIEGVEVNGAPVRFDR